MEKFNIVICDDDAEFAMELRERVREIAEANGCIFYIKVLYNADDLVTYCSAGKVDIILTDIDMPNEDASKETDVVNTKGFEAVQSIQRQYKDMKVVFVSGHEEFAYRSFDCKPFSFVSKREPERLYRALTDLIELLKTRRALNKCVTLVADNKTRPIDVDTIMYFKSKKNYVSAYSHSGEVDRYRCSMAEVYRQLACAYFINVHRSYLINCRFIYSFDKYRIELANGMEIHVTRDAKKYKEAMGIYMEYKRSLR